MKRQHRHAALIQQWLDDDSLEVEIEHQHCPDWEFVAYPRWDEGRNYRFKPKMIRCGNMEFPEPIRVAPDRGDTYYVPNISSISLFTGLLWSCSEYDLRVFDRGLCHTTQAAAEAHANALIALTEAKP